MTVPVTDWFRLSSCGLVFVRCPENLHLWAFFPEGISSDGTLSSGRGCKHGNYPSGSKLEGWKFIVCRRCSGPMHSRAMTDLEVFHYCRLCGHEEIEEIGNDD